MALFLASSMHNETAKITDPGVLAYWLVANVAVDRFAKRIAGKLMHKRGILGWMYRQRRPDERRVLNGVVNRTSVVDAGIHRNGQLAHSVRSLEVGADPAQERYTILRPELL